MFAFAGFICGLKRGITEMPRMQTVKYSFNRETEAYIRSRGPY